MEQSTVRPYATALFESAKRTDSFDRWEFVLSVLSETAQIPTMAEKIESPAVSSEEVRSLFEKCCGDLIGSEGERLLSVLKEHNRFVIIPELYSLYKSMLFQRRGVKNAVVVSAIELEESLRSDILLRLEKRWNCSIKAEWNIDPEILGGLIITVDDTIVDASVRGRLGQMASALKV